MELLLLAILAAGASAGSVIEGWSKVHAPLDRLLAGWTCFDYTLDLCTLPSGVIITKVTVDDPTTCQLFCRIYADCQMWTFDEGIQGENCFLINMDPNLYISSCLEFGGPDYPTVDMCINESQTSDCSKFTKGKCTYPSGTLEVLPDVAEPPADGSAGCDDACKLRSDCVYWKYLFESDDCVLYKSRDKSCLLTRGTRYPDLLECETAAVPCRGNEDCLEPQVCIDGFCGLCTEDSQCEAGEACDNGQCVLQGCQSDTDCPANLPHCDTSDGECYVCVTDAHCPAGVCDANICVECIEDADCPTGVCDEPNFTCVGCTDDSECPADHVCSDNLCYECIVDGDCAGENVCASDNTCVECLDASNCPMGVCDMNANICVDCILNADCPNAEVCYGNQCFECVENTDCPLGQLCSDNVCYECLTDTDCENSPIGPVCSSSNTCVECEIDDECADGVCEVSSNICFECLEDIHCTNSTSGPVCADSNMCVECVDDIDCPEGDRCSSSNICTGCLNDADCTDPEFCHDGSCIECLNNSECTDQVCSPNNTCVDCLFDSDCLNGVCDLSSNICFECLEDADCSNPAQPICSTSNSTLNTCVECENDDQCTDGVCQVSSNTCFECLSDFNCMNSTVGPFCSNSSMCVECETDVQCPDGVCQVSTNLCFECLADSDCTNSTMGPVCSNSNMCVECESDMQCPNGVCDELTNICFECLLDADCTDSSAPICSDSNTCVECLFNSDCTNSDEPICSNSTCVECVVDNDCGAGICQSTNTCGCNKDSDCLDTEICSSDFCFINCPNPSTCRPGCRVDIDCQQGECSAGECEFCDNDFDETPGWATPPSNECEPGCSSDANCDEEYFCDYLHGRVCSRLGSVVLNAISITTDNCTGCEAEELAAVISITGEKPVNQEAPTCTTNNLDNVNETDYEPGFTALFNSTETLARCKGANLNGNNYFDFNVTWNGQGIWAPSEFKLMFTGGDIPPNPRCCKPDPGFQFIAGVTAMIDCGRC